METVWIQISADDLNDYQAGKLINAARTKALAGGQADPFAKVMADVTNTIRAKIRARRTNRVSNLANSVPPTLRSQAILLIIEKMQSRLPGVSLDDDIKTVIKDAKADVESLSRKENPLPVEQPTDADTADDVQVAGSITMGKAKCDPHRITTRERMRNL